MRITEATAEELVRTVRDEERARGDLDDALDALVVATERGDAQQKVVEAARERLDEAIRELDACSYRHRVASDAVPPAKERLRLAEERVRRLLADLRAS